jgi:translation initiation factor 5A
MTNDGTAKDDVKVPEGDLGNQIQANFDEGKDLLVTIISAMGEEQVCSLHIPTFNLPSSPLQAISFKEAPKGA